MTLHEILSNCINQACCQVFSTMMGVELAPGEVSVETATPDANDGVVSLIGLAGTWTGTGSVGCSPALACRICAQLLMTDVQAVNEEVLDAVAELTNMVVGSVKTDLEQHLGPLGLSIPTVVYGRNFKMRSTKTTEWTTLRFDWDGEPLLVRLSLAPTQETGHLRMHAPPAHACDVEM
jgi:chemotaxis protein CheX